MAVYIVIDPGLKNCCVVLLFIDEKNSGSTKIMYVNVGDLSKKKALDDKKAIEFFTSVTRFIHDIISEHKLLDEGEKPLVIVEYQPPLRTMANCGLVRINSWIEGFVTGYFSGDGYKVIKVFPSVVKKFWNVASGEYHVNKRLAILKAVEIVDNPDLIDSDHVADCVLNGSYYYLSVNSVSCMKTTIEENPKKKIK